MFDVYSDSSLIDYFDDTCTFAANQNGTGGTPADGAEVKCWVGKLGVLTASTASTPGTLTGPAYKASGAGGKPGLTCAVGKALSLGQPTAVTNFLNATNPTYTAIVVCKPTTIGGFRFALTKSANGNTSARLCLGVTPAAGGEPVAGNAAMVGPPAIVNQFLVMAVACEMGTDTRNIRKATTNGFGGSGGTAGTADTTSDIYIGSQGKTASPFTQNEFIGEIYAAFFFNRYLSPVELKIATDQIHAHYSQTLPDAACRHNIILDCNSICSITDFVRIFNRRLGNHPIHILGWGGKSGADQLKWFQKDYLPLARYLAGNGLPTITALHEITNDMQGGGAPEPAYQNNRRYLTQSAPWSSKRIVVTCIDRSSTFSRDNLMRANGYLRRNWAEFADAICDLKDTVLDEEDWWTSGLFTGDAVHPRSPSGMDPFRDVFGLALATLMNAPSSAATTWTISPPDAQGPLGATWPGGQTTGQFYVTPNMGTAVSAVATIASSNASDVITSTDPSWSGTGNTGTLTWGASGPGSWIGRPFNIKFGTTTGARTISVTVSSVVVASISMTPRYFNSDSKALMLFGLAATSSQRAKGQTSKPFGLIMATNTNSALGQLYGLTPALTGTVTITASTGGTINVIGGSTTWDGSNSELFATVTHDPGATSPITMTITSTISGITIPDPFDWHFDDTDSAVVLVAPPATAPRTVKAADSYMGIAKVNNTTGTVVVTPLDSLGRTISPATLTFGPSVTCLPYYLTAGSASGTHSITTTNNGSLSNPSAVTFADTAGPYPGDIGFTAINPTSITITVGNPTGGTSPFTYLFQYAVESSGLPGTWTNIGTATSSQTATLTGLTASTRYFLRCTVTDSASIASTSHIYDFVTSDLTAGTTTTSGITAVAVTATTTGGTLGFGALAYQARKAPDVSGSPGTFSNSGSPGTSKTATITGLSPTTSSWYQFAATDSHPLAHATVFDSPVKATTLAAETYSGVSNLTKHSLLQSGAIFAMPAYHGTASLTRSHPTVQGLASRTNTNMSITYANLAVSKAASNRSSGVSTLTVTTGEGAKFGSPSTASPMRVVVYRDDDLITILKVVGVASDVLTIDGTMDGYADADVQTDDDLENVPTAGDFKDLWTATATVARDARLATMPFALPIGADQSVWNGNASNGTVVKTTFKSSHIFQAGCRYLKVVFANFGTSGITANTLSAAIEYPVGTVIPLSFGGKAKVDLSVNSQVVSDPIYVIIPTGAKAFIRTCFAQGGSAVWPVGKVMFNAASDANGDAMGCLITGATNATPIVIATSGNHNFTTGDSCTISAVNGNTAANGTWTVTKVDATHFSLNTSVGNGAFTFFDWNGTCLGSDLTLASSGAMKGSSGATLIHCPIAVLAKPITSAASVAIIGDSIGFGTNDQMQYPNNGYLERALAGAHLSYANLSNAGLSADALNTSPVGNYTLRLLHLHSGDYVICQLGVNDCSFKSVAQTQANLLTIWNSVAETRVIQTTITPRTTSTDSWATTTNQKPAGLAISAASNASPIQISTNGAGHSLATGQTVQIYGVGGNTAANGTWTVTVVAFDRFTLNTSVGNGTYTSGGFVGNFESIRKDLNSWLRDGAPVTLSPLTAAATGATTPGVIRIGNAGHPLWRVVDPAALVEVNISNAPTANGGYWIVNGTANYATAEGLHPSPAAHALMVPGIPTSDMVAW